MTDVTLRFTGTESGLSAQFARANRSLDDLNRNTSRASAAIQTGFKAIGAAVAAIQLGRLVSEVIQYADELTKASARTGIAVEALQRLQFVADQADVEFGTLTNAINRLQNTLVLAEEGSDQAAKALARLGIPVNEFIGLRADEQFSRVSTAISGMESSSERTATAIGLFGRSGAELLPILSQTGDELAKVQANFAALGGAIGADSVARVDEIGDAMGRLKVAAKNLGTELLALAEPAITPTLDALASVVAGFRALDGETGNRVADIEKRIRGLNQAIAFTGESGSTGRDRVRKFREEIRRLTLELEVLKGTGFGGQLQEAALAPLSFDPTTVGLPESVSKGLARIDTGEPTVAQRRDAALAADNPAVTFALDEKDLLLQIEEEKLAEMLRLQEEHFLRENAIASESAEFRAGIRELFGLQEITFESAKAASIFDIGSGLLGALAAQNTKFAKIQQALAIATVIYDTSRAVMAAIATLNYGAAAKAAVMGGIQLAKIKATNYSGGSVSGGGGGFSVSGGATASGPTAPTTPAVPAGATQGNVLRVEVIGMVTKEAARAIAEEIGEVVNSGDVVFINANSTQADVIRRGIN